MTPADAVPKLLRGTGHVPLPGGLRLEALSQATAEGLRLLRNNPAVRRWYRYREEITPAQQQAWFSQYLSSPEQSLWVATTTDRAVVGAGGLSHVVAGRSAEFGRLMRAPEVQVRGLGRAITEAVLDIAWLNGLVALRLVVKADNHRALDIYTDLGFRTVGQDQGWVDMELVRDQSKA